MRIHTFCPVCQRAIDVRVLDFVPSRFWKDFQCPLCHEWLACGLWARLLFGAVTLGVSGPLFVFVAQSIDRSGMSEWRLFQSDDGKMLGVIFAASIMVSLAAFGIWCGAFTIGKVSKLKKAPSAPPLGW
ncbi:hypothetical protein AB4076_12295 [Dyella sp. 2RAF44]|uniref:hypothetical protein n=1 Tax=Dyella sp. 2RAF44 TaxID=3233000 RepID=UPI003F8E6E4A